MLDTSWVIRGRIHEVVEPCCVKKLPQDYDVDVIPKGKYFAQILSFHFSSSHKNPGT
jgi:hypothetical protein